MIPAPPIKPVSLDRPTPSKNQTAAGWNVSMHYERLGVDDRWNGTNRVDRLCQLLKITIFELADIIRVSHHQMERWHKQRNYPATVCLWFSLIEYCFFNHLIPDPIEGELLPWSKLDE